MHAFWRRLILACVSLVCLSLPACMQVPLCIPELSYVTPVDLGPAAAEVHAFRVDVTQKTVVNINRDFHADSGCIDYYELTPMQLSASGTTSSRLVSYWYPTAFSALRP